MKVIPTILTTNLNDWLEQMKLFPKYFDRIQLDVADGSFVPNTTTQITEMNNYLSTHEKPFTANVTFDFHLMVQDYQRAIESINEFSAYLKVNTILINSSLKPDMANLRQQYPTFDIGLDIDDKTTTQWVLNNFDLSTLNSIQIMTVTQGFQGSSFLPEMLNKITDLRKAHYRNKIFIDGGINETTLETILSQVYQPDYLCIGSYLTKAEDKLEERINNLNFRLSK